MMARAAREGLRSVYPRPHSNPAIGRSMPDRTLIYVGDPMCSWCWGFAPTVRQAVDLVGDRANFSIITGGLRSETEPVPAERRAMYRRIWPEIQQRTGQTFANDLVDAPHFRYDTEPSCRAVVTARSMTGDLAALDLFVRLQAAFYVENLDVTQEDCCISVAVKAGYEPSQFSDRFTSEALRTATQEDFSQARSLGATGFPTVITTEASQGSYLTRGYQPFWALRAPLEDWLGRADQTASPEIPPP